ncbi:hypothetical protein PR048_007619, partial [Dryococelus australis]
MDARNLISKRKSIRSFQPPKINFLATDHIKMIHWKSTTTLLRPPLLRSGTAAEWNFDKFPCHTQVVERCVKLITEASQKVVGSNLRDGFTRTTLLQDLQCQVFQANLISNYQKK